MKNQEFLYFLIPTLVFILILPSNLVYSQSSNEVASMIGNLARRHQEAWGYKSKYLYTRDQIDNTLDVKLRTLYSMPNKNTTIAFAYSNVPSWNLLLRAFETGMVVTNESIYFRDGSLFGRRVKRFRYREIYRELEFTWDENIMYVYNKGESKKSFFNRELPLVTMALFYNDIPTPYMINLIESVAEFITVEIRQ